jgi:membrane-bound inhibitor of C-type lysozyme
MEPKIIQNNTQTSQKTPRFLSTKVNQSILFRETITVYGKKYMKYEFLCWQNGNSAIVRGDGTCIDHRAQKG